MRLLVVALLLSPLVAGQSQPQAPATSQAPAPAPVAAPNQSPAAAPAMPEARAQDVDSVDHIIAALYDVISGPAGQARARRPARPAARPHGCRTHAAGRQRCGTRAARAGAAARNWPGG